MATGNDEWRLHPIDFAADNDIHSDITVNVGEMLDFLDVMAGTLRRYSLYQQLQDELQAERHHANEAIREASRLAQERTEALAAARDEVTARTIEELHKKARLLKENVEGHCAVCLEKFSADMSICTLDCKHDYHLSCIVTWLVRKRTCPLCRSKQ